MHLWFDKAVVAPGTFKRWEAKDGLLVLAAVGETSIALTALLGDGGWHWSVAVVYVGERNGGPVEDRATAEKAAMAALAELQKKHENDFGEKLKLPWE